jgi:cyclomaltodextrin glucanotransferase
VPGAPAGHSDNIGYLGGDFKGLLDNAGYIRGMGFGAVWVTPIVDNPDEAFTGGDPVKWGSMFTDRGKTGFHGYWASNFYKLDEHLPSEGLDFRRLDPGPEAAWPEDRARHRLQSRLAGLHHARDAADVRQALRQGRHADRRSPEPAPGQARSQGQPAARVLQTPPRAWRNCRTSTRTTRACSSTFVGAYSQWIEQGADAFRIDTIPWMPHAYWHAFTTRIREKHPGFFMFGEAFNYDAATIAAHTLPRNAGVSVLDFPLKERVAEVFGRQGGGFERIAERLYLEDGPYQNPYDLMTFYDNHDMARLDASDDGFIDANNFLFTARGIPVIYYGSETGFERGTAEHMRQSQLLRPGTHRRRAAQRDLPVAQRIGSLRAATPALQRGLQVNVLMQGERAAFYRVLQQGDTHQIALVLLNKGAAPAAFAVKDLLQAGRWHAALGGETSMSPRAARCRRPCRRTASRSMSSMRR